MVLLKQIVLFIFLLAPGCAKLSYLVEQGSGQLSLQNRAISNERAKLDPRLSPEQRQKIGQIEKYKDYFFHYFHQRPTKIYSQTTYLEDPAVTYLVIVAPYDEVKAEEECFPIMGCFPYLGFFKEESAKAYQKKKEDQHYVTFRRPVYAYSTLGHFTDTILTSFFHFNEFDLAELIFHELFHTIYFVKNEVELNENLAQYFGRQMAMSYFNLDKDWQKNEKEKNQKRQKLTQEMVLLTQELNAIYQKQKFSAKDLALDFFKQFMETQFRPRIKQKCEQEKILEKECFPLKREWNNASLAAYLTYEEKVDSLEKWHQHLQISLNDFYLKLVELKKEYDNGNKKMSFAQFLTGQMP